MASRKRKQDAPDVTVKMKGLPLAPKIKTESVNGVEGGGEEEESVPVQMLRNSCNKAAAGDIKLALAGSADFVAPSADDIARLKARREQARRLSS